MMLYVFLNDTYLHHPIHVKVISKYVVFRMHIICKCILGLVFFLPWVTVSSCV